jgi:hypothetical protein
LFLSTSNSPPSSSSTFFQHFYPIKQQHGFFRNCSTRIHGGSRIHEQNNQNRIIKRHGKKKPPLTKAIKVVSLLKGSGLGVSIVEDSKVISPFQLTKRLSKVMEFN